MDKLHTIIRDIRHETKGATKPRRDHLTVFREFLSQLDRVTRRVSRGNAKNKAAKPAARRGK
jgi:hypothetical protein